MALFGAVQIHADRILRVAFSRLKCRLYTFDGEISFKLIGRLHEGNNIISSNAVFVLPRSKLKSFESAV